MTPFALHCQDLSRTYGTFRAVQNLSLTVNPEEILALVGPSGCGKTTTLRLIAGFELPDRGSIDLNGRTVASENWGLPPEKRAIGMVFQEAALFPHLTVFENTIFGLNGARMEKKLARGEAMLELVGLRDARNKYPHQLSGGERQRIALARALSPHPELLLLDEPFSNLDAELRHNLREDVRAILKNAKISAVFVTHDQEEALYMGDRLAVMRQGAIEQIGTPEEVFGCPATRFVAEFMGDAQFLSGVVTHEGIQSEAGLVQQASHLPVGTSVDLAVRADDLTFLIDPNADVVVQERIYKGMLTVYKLKLHTGKILLSMQPHTSNIKAGTPVRILVEPGHPLACFPN